MACAASILLIAGCAAGEPPGKPSPPEVGLEGVQFRAWRGAGLAASGTADRVVYRRNSGEVEASGVP